MSIGSHPRDVATGEITSFHAPLLSPKKEERRGLGGLVFMALMYFL
jgi:hypothetical protein